MTRSVSADGRRRIAEAQRRRVPMGKTRRCLADVPEPNCTGVFVPRVGNQKRCHVCCAADPWNLRGNKVRRGTLAPDGTPIRKPRSPRRMQMRRLEAA